MNKEDFITNLQHALAGGLPGGQVAENVRYYREYIDSEIHRGSTEEEVLAALGDPRLLAKSIIDAIKRAGVAYGSNRGYDEEVADDTPPDDGYEGKNSVRRVMLPGWLVMILIAVIVIFVIFLLGSLLISLAPFIMAAVVVMVIIRAIQGNRR